MDSVLPLRGTQFTADLASVRAARGLVRTEAQAAGISPALLADLELVVSELVTNGVVHGAGGHIGVGFEPGPPAALAVTSGLPAADSRPVGPPSGWAAPPPHQISGRGLFLVATLSGDVRVQYHDQLLTIACRFPWAAR